jgi:hypothetical protein
MLKEYLACPSSNIIIGLYTNDFDMGEVISLIRGSVSKKYQNSLNFHIFKFFHFFHFFAFFWYFLKIFAFFHFFQNFHYFSIFF